MKINVRVHIKSRDQKIEQKDDIWHIYINEIPENGKANAKVQTVLANYFDKPLSCVKLIRGFKSKDKIFNIDD